MTTMAGSAHPGRAAGPGRTRHVLLRDERGHLGLRRPWPGTRWFGGTRGFESPKPLPARSVTGAPALAAAAGAEARQRQATVEQQAYADMDGSGRIALLDLLCTGYRPEGGHD